MHSTFGPRLLLSFALVAIAYLGFSSPKPSHAAADIQEKKEVSVLEMDVIPRTPERMARGKYLVEGLLQCPYCHSEIDFSKRPATAFPGKRFGGYVFPDYETGMPKPNLIVAPNISPDPEYGAGTWKDAVFVRALRQGIGHDGRTLFPLMPYEFFRSMSDEDLASVIVYVRSQPPSHVKEPKIVLADDVKKMLKPFDPLPHVPEPNHSDRVAYGKYLVTIGHCAGCHSTFDDKGNPVPGMDFAGGSPLVGDWNGDGKLVSVNALNLTPDASGIGYFTEDMFIEVLRNGGFKTRQLSSIMPWVFFRNLTDDDLKAMYAYLRTLKPVCHHVDNTEPPTYCKQCRNKHGLGAMNEAALSSH